MSQNDKPFTFYVKNPFGKKNRMAVNTKATRGQRMYKPADVEAFEWEVKKAAQDALRLQKWDLTKNSIGTTCIYDFVNDELIVTMRDLQHPPSKRTKDLQNMMDIVFDVLEGMIYEKDRQVEDFRISEMR